jgi:thioredoxin 1
MTRNAGILLLFTLIATSFSQPFREPAPPGQQDSSRQIEDRIVNSKKPVLVDFWASWCPPCRMLDPLIKKLEKEYRGKVTFIKVDVERHRQIAEYFRVKGIPAVFFIKDRAVQTKLIGFQPEESYREALELLIATPKTPPVDSSSKNKSVADTL